MKMIFLPWSASLPVSQTGAGTVGSAVVSVGAGSVPWVVVAGVLFPQATRAAAMQNTKHKAMILFILFSSSQRFFTDKTYHMIDKKSMDRMRFLFVYTNLSDKCRMPIYFPYPVDIVGHVLYACRPNPPTSSKL